MSRLALAFVLTLLVPAALARADQPAAPPTAPQPWPPQPPAPPQQQSQPTVPLDAFLEQRVSEELAAKGTLLSRLGVTLDVEVIGPRAIISLVDPATRRALASTKIDELPADREAAVASVAQVAAGLVAQLARPAAPPARPAEQTTVVVKEMLDRDREERREHEAAEYRYRQEALSFGNEVRVFSNGQYTSVSRRWVAYQGDIRKRLEGDEFYKIIGRPDLAKQYQRRKDGGTTAMVLGVVGMVGGSIYMLAKGFPGYESCFDAPNMSQCERDRDARESDAKQHLAISLAITLAGSTVFSIGWYYVRNPHPISEGEAQTLGAQYNTELRKKHNLSTQAAPRRRGRSLFASPYLTGDGGGLALTGRF